MKGIARQAGMVAALACVSTAAAAQDAFFIDREVRLIVDKTRVAMAVKDAK